MSEMTLKTTNGMNQQEPKPVRPGRRATLVPRVDIFEQADKLVLFVDMPGVKPQDVELHFEKGELTVRGHRDFAARQGRCLVEQYGAAEYQRSFLIGQDIAADRITADLRHGVLTVELPRSPAALPRKIEVKG